MRKLPIFLFLLSIYLFTSSGRLYVRDEGIMFLVTKGIVERGRFDIPSWFGEEGLCKGKDGRLYSPYGIAQSLFAIPFFLVGSLLDRIFHTNYLSISFISLLNPFISSIICIILFQFCNRFYSKKTSFLLTIFYGLGTLAFPYAKYFFAAPLTTLCLIVSVYSTYMYIKNGKPIWIVIAGISMGIGISTRLTAIIALPAIVFYILLYATVERWSLKKVSSCILGFIIPIIPFLLLIGWYNWIRFDSIFKTGYHALNVAGELDFTTPLYVGLYGMLLSSGKGIFLYSPIIILFFSGIRYFYRIHKMEAILFCLIPCIFLVFYSSWVCWEGGVSWGPRFLVPVLPFLVIPIGTFIEKPLTRLLKCIVVSLFLISLFIQLVGVSIDFTKYINIIREKYENGYFLTIFHPEFSPIIGHINLLLNRYPFDFWFIYLYNKGVSIIKVILPAVSLLVTTIVISGFLCLKHYLQKESS